MTGCDKWLSGRAGTLIDCQWWGVVADAACPTLQNVGNHWELWPKVLGKPLGSIGKSIGKPLGEPLGKPLGKVPTVGRKRLEVLVKAGDNVVAPQLTYLRFDGAMGVTPDKTLSIC